MSTICVVAPPQWQPLVDALAAAGHECVSLLGSRASSNAYGVLAQVSRDTTAFEAALGAAGPPALIDLQKTGRAVGAVDVLVHQIGVLGMNLSTAYGVRRFVEESVRQLGAAAVVVICTCDVPGRAALLGARAAGVPLVHVQHACASDPPERAWYVGEEPGDVVLVPGERDRDWWQRCNPAAKVLVTGHALWDHYHAVPKLQRPEETVLLWGDQSPTNQEQQTADYWQSRDVPELAWQAFLGYLETAQGIDGVVLKCRSHEADGYTRGRWDALTAACAKQLISCGYQDGPPVEAFRGVSLVICQDSNLGVEAMHLGIPVLSITRPGSLLFDRSGALLVSGLHPELLGEAIQEALDWPALTTERQINNAVHYNKGAADGDSMACVVAAISVVASYGVEKLERSAELVTV